MVRKSAKYSATIEDTPIDMDRKPEDGWHLAIRWMIDEQRLGAKYGTVGYAVIPPGGGRHERHLHENAEEFTYYFRGRGIRHIGDEFVEVQAGEFGFVPAGVPHSMRNPSDTEPLEILCVYMGGPSLQKAGYTLLGDLTQPVVMPDVVRKSAKYSATIEDTPIDMDRKPEDGWHLAIRWMIDEQRLGAKYGTVGYAVIPPGGGRHERHLHENAEEFTYYFRGRGIRHIGDEFVEVQAGEFGFVPAGVPHSMRNPSDTEPLEILCVYMGGPSLQKAGYTLLRED